MAEARHVKVHAANAVNIANALKQLCIVDDKETALLVAVNLKSQAEKVIKYLQVQE